MNDYIGQRGKCMGKKENAQCLLADRVVFLCHELKIASVILNELFDISDIFQLRHDFFLLQLLLVKEQV